LGGRVVVVDKFIYIGDFINNNINNGILGSEKKKKKKITR